MFAKLNPSSNLNSQDGDKKPGGEAATTYRPSFNEEDVMDMVSVGIITRELGDKLISKGRMAQLAQQNEDALERENEVEAMPETGRKEIATRRYELMKDDTVAREGEFMPRLDLSKTMNNCKKLFVMQWQTIIHQNASLIYFK